MRNYFYLIFVLFLLCFCFTQIYSQQKQISYQANEMQWEYLVVSFGQTEFSTPEKMLAYKIVGIIDGKESLTLQSKIDILGHFGWELINTVGAISGDQQLIFKRKYDKIRTANEYGLIKSGKEIYLKDLQDIIERSLHLEEEQKKYEEQIKNKPRLINLDEVDATNKRVEYLKSMESLYKNEFNKTEIASISEITVNYVRINSADLSIIIEVDLTDKFLINGNSYRASVVKQFLQEFLKSYRFRDNSIPDYTFLLIEIKGFIKFNGEKNYISSENCTSYSRSNWTCF